MLEGESEKSAESADINVNLGESAGRVCFPIPYYQWNAIPTNPNEPKTKRRSWKPFS